MAEVEAIEEREDSRIIIAVHRALRDQAQAPVWFNMLETLMGRFVPKFGEEELARFDDMHRALAFRQEEVEWDRVVNKFLSEDAGELIQSPEGLAGTTRRQALGAVRGILSDPELADKGMDFIARELDDQLTGINRVRATRIARTEVVRASAIGTEAAGLEIQKHSGEIVFEWIATRDDRTRIPHLELDGLFRTTSGTFDMNGYPARYPADVSLPARLAVNCRCAIASLPREDVDESLIMS